MPQSSHLSVASHPTGFSLESRVEFATHMPKVSGNGGDEAAWRDGSVTGKTNSPYFRNAFLGQYAVSKLIRSPLFHHVSLFGDVIQWIQIK